MPYITGRAPCLQHLFLSPRPEPVSSRLEVLTSFTRVLQPVQSDTHEYNMHGFISDRNPQRGCSSDSDMTTDRFYFRYYHITSLIRYSPPAVDEFHARSSGNTVVGLVWLWCMTLPANLTFSSCISVSGQTQHCKINSLLNRINLLFLRPRLRQFSAHNTQDVSY